MNFEIYEGKKIYSSTSEYEVEEILGRGGFGQALRCLNVHTRKSVVLKIIKNQDYIEEAQHEALVLQHLKDLGSEMVNIVKFYDAFTFSGHFCLELESLDIDLKDYTRSCPLTLPQIRPILKQVAETLWFLHENGCIHGDLKPENIMVVDRLQKSPKVKLIDFGMTIKQECTERGMEFGTLIYEAPEMLLGAFVTQAIDIWALGCSAVKLLTGTVLFPADNEHDLMDLIVSTIGMPPWLCLAQGVRTQRYFYQNRKTWPPKWTKSSGCRPVEISCNPFFKLRDLLEITHEGSEEEKEASEYDLACFIDLLVKMLHMDPRERATAEEILEHPFITLGHLTRRSSSYLQESRELLEACSSEDEPADPHSFSPGETSAASEEAPSLMEKREDEPSDSPCKMRCSSPSTSQYVTCTGPHLEEEEEDAGPEEPPGDLADKSYLRQIASAGLSALRRLLPPLLVLLCLFLFAHVLWSHFSVAPTSTYELRTELHPRYPWATQRNGNLAALNGYHPAVIGPHRATTTGDPAQPRCNETMTLLTVAIALISPF